MDFALLLEVEAWSLLQNTELDGILLNTKAFDLAGNCLKANANSTFLIFLILAPKITNYFIRLRKFTHKLQTSTC